MQAKMRVRVRVRVRVLANNAVLRGDLQAHPSILCSEVFPTPHDTTLHSYAPVEMVNKMNEALQEVQALVRHSLQ